VQILGANGDDLEWIERKDGERLACFGLDTEGRVRGAVLVDNGREATPLRRIIAAGKALDRERLIDLSVALRQLC
jgi:hypothetical protein